VGRLIAYAHSTAAPSAYAIAKVVATAPRGNQRLTAPQAAPTGQIRRASNAEGSSSNRNPIGTITSMPTRTSTLTSTFMVLTPVLERVQVVRTMVTHQRPSRRCDPAPAN
jgi:hypothetical protein